MRVLLICTGNTCRSPMAEHVLRQILRTRLGQDQDMVYVESAGTDAIPGMPMSEGAAAALGRRGITGIEHKARQVTKDMIAQADLILTMAESHRERVLKEEPSSRGKVFTLSEYAGRDGDIKDPFLSSNEVYARTLDDMIPLLETVAEKIIQEAHKGKGSE